MTPEERQQLISQYAAGYDEIANSLKDFPQHLLTERPSSDRWSACEIVQHLADSEMTSALRLRHLLTETHPVIQGYDQDDYAERLNYNERDLLPALDAVRGARATTAQLLAKMTDADWAREGWHTESGRYTAETWLKIYAAHAHNHAEQIRRARETLASSKR